MSWYRIHRPKLVSELHLTDVKNTLLGFMSDGKIPQVLLFAGPKGTGKTSSARIIGALLNDAQNEQVVDHQFFGAAAPKQKAYVEPDPTDAFNQKIYAGQSYVVQELDAASNRGIDDVRALKERVSVPPAQGKITVYILDEAHMLTTEAFNALLKLLEEPPPHAVFILATTELHKIPGTIASRSSLIQFRRATTDELIAAMQAVLEQEKISFEAPALELIAQKADGSFRDAVKLLEMVATQGAVTQAAAIASLHGSLHDEITRLISLIIAKDDTGIAELFQELRNKNTDDVFFFKSLLNTLHQSLLQQLGVVEGEPAVAKSVALFLLKELSQITLKDSPIPFLPLELKLLELVERAKVKNNSGSGSEPSPTVSVPEKRVAKKTEVAKVVAEHAAGSGDSKQLLTKWPELLSAVKEKNMTLEALLRSAKPMEGIDGTATVAVFYKFHKEQLEQPKFRMVIEECVTPLAGGPVKMEYILSDLPAEAELVEDPSPSPTLAALAEEALI